MRNKNNFELSCPTIAAIIFFFILRHSIIAVLLTYINPALTFTKAFLIGWALRICINSWLELEKE